MRLTPAGPVEAKVAASGFAAFIVSGFLGLAATYHWFTPPPPYLTGYLVTVVSAAIGWLAPHTPRPDPPPL